MNVYLLCCFILVNIFVCFLCFLCVSVLTLRRTRNHVTYITSDVISPQHDLLLGRVTYTPHYATNAMSLCSYMAVCWTYVCVPLCSCHLAPYNDGSFGVVPVIRSSYRYVLHLLDST